jgi:hypothetical protein
MSHSSKSLLLDEQIGLLVRHFGIQRVRAAVAKSSIEGDEEPHAPSHKTVSRDQKPTRPTIVEALESIRESDPEKHRLLSEFLSDLKDRRLLPESQDIRHFAQLVGLKDIRSKSRKEMIPTLMRFFMDQTAERLRIDIRRADNVSEQQRRQGFSVLTDKLLGEK